MGNKDEARTETVHCDTLYMQTAVLPVHASVVSIISTVWRRESCTISM